MPVAAILIPALEPDDRLPAYVTELLEGGFRHVVVVDDGSSQKAQPIFDRMAAMPGVQVLHHDVNHGKGVALKTGFRWMLDNLSDIDSVITADSDGQHTVPDCINLARTLAADRESSLYLGSRDFNLPDVPERSKKGNHITSTVFKLLYGQYLPDTQTGLRAFRREELPMMLEVEGERYEYEMNQLIACARRGIPMKAVTIKTVYENNNEGSHFHPIRDSWRIYKVILGSFFKFMFSSIVGWLVDQGMSHVLYYQLLPALGVAAKFMSPIATTCARIVSAVVNYLLNRTMVFKSKEKGHESAWRYAVLALGIWGASTGITWLLEQLGLPMWLMKLVVDILLYFVSYRVQADWVFSEKSKGGRKA